MKKSTRNYIIGIIMFLLAAFETVSGFVLWLILPTEGKGYMGGRGGGPIVAGTFLRQGTPGLTSTTGLVLRWWS
jgi:hypothetical protein